MTAKKLAKEAMLAAWTADGREMISTRDNLLNIAKCVIHYNGLEGGAKEMQCIILPFKKI